WSERTKTSIGRCRSTTRATPQGRLTPSVPVSNKRSYPNLARNLPA
ncbi:hypothetical protein CGCVW01_v007646, partial [Colletotrichum viniferum]